MDFIPSKTIKKFLDSQHRRRFIIGPVGSGKTDGCCVDIVNKSRIIPVSQLGKRISMWAVIRNTDRQLIDTTLPSFLRMFPDGVAGEWRERDFEFELAFADVLATIKFRCLDKEKDQRRVLSMNLTGIYLNEFREIKPSLFEAVDARAGRFQPSVGGWYGLIGDSNPPEEFSYWANVVTKKAQPGLKDALNCEVFWQPSGLSPEAENVNNLRPNYYQELATGKSLEWINVHIKANLGSQRSGSAVYGDSFNRKLHVGTVNYDHLMPVYIGMDFGLLPALVIAQIDINNNLLILASVVSDGPTGIEQLMKGRGLAMLRKVCPLTNFNDVHIFTDIPKRSESDMKTAYHSLKELGFKNIKPGTIDNRIDTRLSAVRKRLTELGNRGTPRILFSNSGLAESIITSTESGYVFKNKKFSDNELSGHEPDKNKHSHVADALQYLCLGLDLYGSKIINIYRHDPQTLYIPSGDRIAGY